MNKTIVKRSSHLPHAVRTQPVSLTPHLQASCAHTSAPLSQRPTDKEKPVMIKLIHIEPGGLFVCTLGPQPDKLITTQNITCCPICSDPMCYPNVPGNAKITDLCNVKVDSDG